MAQRTHLKGGTIVTMDPSLGILPSGDILIERGRIAEVAPEIRADGAEVIDASHRIVLPGLVDTHIHLHDYAESTYGATLTDEQVHRYPVDWKGVHWPPVDAFPVHWKPVDGIPVDWKSAPYR